jgi:hypothetical protein
VDEMMRYPVGTATTPGNGTDGMLGLIHQHRLHGVHEPPVDLTRGVAQHQEDGDGDDQPDHRVGKREARSPLR